jgi:hypothetical protein
MLALLEISESGLLRILVSFTPTSRRDDIEIVPTTKPESKQTLWLLQEKGALSLNL